MLKMVFLSDHELVVALVAALVALVRCEMLYVEVEALGSSVLVAINMLVMSACSDSESMEVLVEFVDEEEEDEFDSDGLDSYPISGSEDSEDESWTV